MADDSQNVMPEKFSSINYGKRTETLFSVHFVQERIANTSVFVMSLSKYLILHEACRPEKYDNYSFLF